MGWLNTHDKNSAGYDGKQGEGKGTDATTKPAEKLGSVVKDLRSMASGASVVSQSPSIGEVD
jgi:hypothetical protein